MRDFVFTSSSVLPGHPDKLCDRVSDAIVDAYLTFDPNARVIMECAIASDVMFLVCHGAPGIPVDHAMIARDTVREVGYRSPELDPDAMAAMINLGTVETGDAPNLIEDIDLQSRLVASNNVTVFGYACNQTRDMMPVPIKLAHSLASTIWNKGLGSETLSFGPDGQVQVSVEFRDRVPVRLRAITLLVSRRSNDRFDGSAVREALIEYARDTELLADNMSVDVSINPPGTNLIGGPARHPGLTGRKISVDTYGDFARQGSSALSGKDVTRIERIGAYAARHAAKCVVAAGLSRECEVQISYSAGSIDPISVELDTFGTGRCADAEISQAVKKCFDFRPGAIVSLFDLARLPAKSGGSFYRYLAAFGHMGEREIELPWERTDCCEQLLDEIRG